LVFLHLFLYLVFQNLKHLYSMKKVIGLLGLLIVLLAVANPSMAQLVEWKWDAYKTKFKVPADFKADDTNSGTQFIASNSKMKLAIYPRKGENLTYDAMDENLRAWADASNLTGYGNVNFMPDLNGYWGVWLAGVASDNVGLILALLLVDPDYPEISLYVWLQYDADTVNASGEILQSFTPN
jgi:Dihydro-orotase-like